MKKVLIICAGLCLGGVERFAANISLYAPKDEFAFDYLVFEGYGTDFVDEVELAGAKVITIPSPSKDYVKYVRTLGKLIDENHYDVVHSHTQFNSGLNLWVAKRHGVPVRIAHSHTSAHEHRIGILKQTYEGFMRHLIQATATVFCACGIQAGRWMYGDSNFQIINNGIDTEKFRYLQSNKRNIRMQYDIPLDAFVIGHSGTLSQLKNQEFLIRLMPEILKQKKNAYLMLLGRGSDETLEHLKSVASQLGVRMRIRFTGPVMNVNECLSAFDVFAFPSLREGTPLALLEAQSNGLPCIISDTIPQDAALTELVTPLSLTESNLWINALCNAERDTSGEYSEIVSDKGFGVETAFAPLYELYRQ